MRFVLPKTYAKLVGYGLTSITKSINKGWIDLTDFHDIEGKFIDTKKYPPDKYFNLIIDRIKNKRHKKFKQHQAKLF